MHFIKKHFEFITVITLITFFFMMGLTSLIRKSPTFDETVHLTGGYVALSEKDYRINPENGILPQIWAALPLLLQKDIEPPDKKNKYWEKCLNWNIADEFLFKSGNEYEKMFLYSRIMILLAAIGAGIAVYFASRQIWGKTGALISLGLFVLSPTIMANSRFVTSDLYSSLFFFLAAWSFQILLERFTLLRLTAMSISVALLFLSKMSAPIIIPVILILIGCKISKRTPWRGKFFKSYFKIKGQWKQALCFSGALIVAGIVSFIAMWGTFGFRYSMLSDDKGHTLIEKNWKEILKADGIPQKTISFTKAKKLLPEAYIYGFAHVLYTSKLRHSFLNGKYSSRGWWYFFPYTFLVKTPPELLLIILLGIIAPWLVKSKQHLHSLNKRRRIIFSRLSFPLALISLYSFLALTSNLNIGHRHLLAIYPPLFLLAGGICRLMKVSLFKKIIFPILLILLLIENFLIYPDYLTYFTPFTGGASTGYKHLVDSSLDWGQDIKGLKKWLKKNNIPDNDVYISYFGSVNLESYGLPQKKLCCYFKQNSKEIFELRGGTYCISATMLQMVYYPLFANWNEDNEMAHNISRIRFRELREILKNNRKDSPNKIKLLTQTSRYYEMLRFAKLATVLRKRDPDHIIGNSILVFELSDEDIYKIIGNELE